ncbi:putative ribonuclease H-like domain-containing protein [Tanacetum coccineum]
MDKKCCLVVTNDYSRFTWVFFLATKDETSGILKSFITELENLVDKKEKIIRCDNGTEFKNKVMSEFCEQKGIKREFSVARTPQQNSVAERRNMTLIEAAKTMLADSKLPTTLWVEAVNTACYVQNRVLIVKPYNKTPYELFRGRTPALRFMRPFGSHVTILNTLDYLGKFDGKLDKGFIVGYLLNSKAFRVYNIRTRKVEENLHIRFLEDKSIIVGTNSNDLVSIEESIGAGHSSKEIRFSQHTLHVQGDRRQETGSRILQGCYTPMVERTKLDEDLSGIPVDQTRYRNINLSLLKSTWKQLNGSFGISKEPSTWVFGIRKTPPLTAYADADHAGCQDTRRSTSKSAQFLGD